MALHGEGEPQPTLLQVATQAATVELFTQWQTYRNGVHLDWDTFRSIDFRALAVATLTAAGFDVKMVDATLQLPQLGDDLREMPKLRKLLTRESPFADDTVRKVEAHRSRFEVKLFDETPDGPPVTLPEHRTIQAIRDVYARNDQVTVQDIVDELNGTTPVQPYGLDSDAIAKHGEQVQG